MHMKALKRGLPPCGERTVLRNEQEAEDGSSPRVRGTRRPAGRQGATDRVIPARAGNASTFPNMQRPEPGHPRACGERSSCKRLCQKRIHDVKERTDVP